MGLRRAMVIENGKRLMTLKYFDIQFAKGKWYAWYYLPFDDEQLKELENTDGTSR